LLAALPRKFILVQISSLFICEICDSKQSEEGLARSDGNEVANLREAGGQNSFQIALVLISTAKIYFLSASQPFS